MAALLAFLVVSSLVLRGLALPVHSEADDMDNYVDEDDYGDYDEDEDMMERLSSEMGEQLFGTPSNETGERVAKWKQGMVINPEELGPYAEGDILFPVARNGIRLQSARWPGGIVPFQVSPYFTPSDMQMIQRAINAYHTHTCIRFVPYSGAERDYLYLTRDETGCWSAVGRTGGPQQVNLQSPGCTSTLGTVIHELMHALGFLHEQNRWERDGYVTIGWQNIEAGRELNFKAAARGSTDGYGVEYDYGSVMHYSAHAFSKNGEPTIWSRTPNVQLGQRSGFSLGDVTKINKMYKSICRRRQLNKLKQ